MIHHAILYVIPYITRELQLASVEESGTVRTAGAEWSGCFMPRVAMMKGRKRSFRVTRGSPIAFSPGDGRASMARASGASRISSREITADGCEADFEAELLELTVDLSSTPTIFRLSVYE
jgi:hypothetical protein